MRSSMNSRLMLRAQAFCREHWQQVLHWREKLQFREEALHLALAGGVGEIGGLVNLFFFYANEFVKLSVLRRPRDPVEVAEEMAAWQIMLIPALGGLVAGLVLHWGLRLVGRQHPLPYSPNGERMKELWNGVYAPSMV